MGFGVAPKSLKVSLELPSNESVRAAVEAGMGATAFSASVAASSLEAGLLHRVAFDLPERAFWVLRHMERYRSRAANALLAIIAGPGSHLKGENRADRRSMRPAAMPAEAKEGVAASRGSRTPFAQRSIDRFGDQNQSKHELDCPAADAHFPLHRRWLPQTQVGAMETVSE